MNATIDTTADKLQRRHSKPGYNLPRESIFLRREQHRESAPSLTSFVQSFPRVPPFASSPTRWPTTIGTVIRLGPETDPRRCLDCDKRLPREYARVHGRDDGRAHRSPVCDQGFGSAGVRPPGSM
ncbi:DUF7563 family protein [Halorubrum sp. DTA46]|uniref:DUF7563 family protein n=1 Tax=Halorubrum sp. DTA46 TaxID=3402162 RepID=UPI003AAB3534